MKPLINKKYRLKKFEAKGGWTFVSIPWPSKGTKTLGKVKGTIDSYEIRKYHLMPMSNRRMMLPVKAEIRKKIKKEAGDLVHVILYPDNEQLQVPEEMLLCLEDEPRALTFFNSLSESERKFYIEWVYSAKREETKVDRLTKTINRLSRNLKLYQKEKE